MSTLVRCIYTSRETLPLSRMDLNRVLRGSQQNNIRRGLTGILVYADGCFMQVLEGQAEDVDAVYASIVRDPRHTGITRIIFEAIPRRSFREWSMGLATPSGDDLSRLFAVGDLRHPQMLLSSLDEGHAKKLLRAFCAGRWRQTISSERAIAA